MDNDISPHGYASPLLTAASKVQNEQKNEEKNEVYAQVPLLAKVIKRLEGRIEATDSIKQAMVIAEKYKVDRESALVVLDIVRQQLETEKRYMEARIARAK